MRMVEWKRLFYILESFTADKTSLRPLNTTPDTAVPIQIPFETHSKYIMIYHNEKGTLIFVLKVFENYQIFFYFVQFCSKKKNVDCIISSLNKNIKRKEKNIPKTISWLKK